MSVNDEKEGAAISIDRQSFSWGIKVEEDKKKGKGKPVEKKKPKVSVKDEDSDSESIRLDQSSNTIADKSGTAGKVTRDSLIIDSDKTVREEEKQEDPK